jgi:hypothetical protein
MIAEDLADFLATNGIGTVGTDLFIGELPLDTNNCLSLVYSPSPEPNKSIPYYTQDIDVWGRFSKFDRGYSKLQEVFDLIHGKENYIMGDYHVYLSFARGQINDNDRDSQRRHLIQLTLSFTFRHN